MSADLTNRLAAHLTMKREELMTLWRQLYGRKARSQIRCELLVQMLAYRIHERACGGLSTVPRQRLPQLARPSLVELPAFQH